MVTFLAGRDKLGPRRLHDRIKNRLQTDHRFENVRRRIASPEEPGPYRVVADTRFGAVTDVETADQSARLELGFRLATETDYEYYWINWIEPDREVLVAWHQDADHPDLGPVHLQVNRRGTPVRHDPAVFVDEHPMAVVEARLDQLPSALRQHVLE